MSRTVDELEIVFTVALAGDTATAEAKPADSTNAPMVARAEVLRTRCFVFMFKPLHETLFAQITTLAMENNIDQNWRLNKQSPGFKTSNHRVVVLSY